ncbi:MgtC/SapB family protein [Candidatus Woesearchaeota archaeon]|nr:MgtC/SapB family protein [Candidatus Woesearchaeota archaeon]
MVANSDVLIRIALSLLASALVGLEREKTRHPAGMRTHMLVCVGSTLITLTSLEMFPGDPARVAAGIVTGIGFLGAGTIFRDKNNVRGLTTAASIWAVAGVGLALGTGAYLIAGIATAAMLLTLEFGRIQTILTGKKRRWS